MTTRLAVMLAGPLALHLALSFSTGVTRALEQESRIGAGAAPTENVLEPIQISHERATDMRPLIIASGPQPAWKEPRQDKAEANDVHAPIAPEIARPTALLALDAPSPEKPKPRGPFKAEGSLHTAH